MKLGIMQPYFFPYAGYFALIKQSDRFIFFDTPQYISSGWVNRNRVLKQDGTPGFITVPLKKAPRETAIRDMEISDTPWKESIFGALTVYKRKAPRYADTIAFLHETLDKKAWTGISGLNCETLKDTAEYLGINTPFDTFSEMDLAIDPVHAPDEWALNISKAMGADTYINPPGGLEFFDAGKYEKTGIDLQFLQINLRPYVQRIGHFEPGLSIIDLLMFNTKEEILDMLDDFEILRGKK